MRGGREKKQIWNKPFMVAKKAEKNKEAAGVVYFSFVFNITGKRLKTFFLDGTGIPLEAWASWE